MRAGKPLPSAYQRRGAVPVNIHALLRAGYGVEDIAVKTGIPVEHLRKLIEKLRRDGRLKAVLGLEKRKKP